jgi:hypothetical protein
MYIVSMPVSNVFHDLKNVKMNLNHVLKKVGWQSSRNPFSI